ncbi:MAG: hypothetical protein ACK529_02150, partial [Alphaproteobacteria bacterium]
LKENADLVDAKAALARLRQEIQSNPTLSEDVKRELIQSLDGLLHNNQISAAALNAARQQIERQYTTLKTEEGAEKLVARAIQITRDDKVKQAEEMSEADLLMCVRPKNREELAQGLSKLTRVNGIGPTAEEVQRLLEHPSTLDAQIKFLGASEESREEAVKAQLDRTQTVAKAANNRNIPEATRNVLAEANALGTGGRPDAAHLTDAMKKKGAPDQNQTEEWKQKNDETKQSVIKSIPLALSVASPADRKAAESVGSPEQIVEKSLALFNKREEGKPPSKDEQAVLRVFVIARADVMFKLLGDDAIALDLEKERGGTLAERTERAYKALKDKPPVKDVPEFALRKLIGASLEEADEKGVAVHNLDTLSKAEFGKMANEISSGFFPGIVEVAAGAAGAVAGAGGGVAAEAGKLLDDVGRRAGTGTELLKKGAGQISAGDLDGAKKTANIVGAAVMRNIEEAAGRGAISLGNVADRVRDGAAGRDALGKGLEKQLDSINKLASSDTRLKKALDKDGDGKVELWELRD